MDLLLIGGGIFVGASLVDAALARGHRLTVFNRGRSRTDWPGDVEVLIGDRSSDLGLLAARRFDAVIDTCAYVPADPEHLGFARVDCSRAVGAGLVTVSYTHLTLPTILLV